MPLTRIMLVDDEMLLRNGLRYLLDWAAEGFEIVAEASNGEEALRLARSLRPSIVLTDVVMPRMNGIDLTRKLKEEFPDIHIVVLSSYDQFDYVKALFKLGVVDYLLKPAMNREELLKLLNTLRGSIPAQKALSTPDELLGEMLFHRGDDSYIEQFQKRGVSFQSNQPFWLLCAKDREPRRNALSEAQEALRCVFGAFPCAHCVTGDRYLLALLQNENAQTEAQFAQLYAPRLASLSGRLVFALPPAFDSLRGLTDAYESARQILALNFYHPDHLLLTGDGLPREARQGKENGVTAALDRLSPKALAESYRWLIEDAAALSTPDEYALKSFIKDSLHAFLQKMKAQGYDTKTLEQEKLVLFRRLQDTPDVAQFMTLTLEICDRLQIIMNTQKQPASHQLATLMKEYIEAHYQEELKLSELAEQFHINYSYCSSLFCRETGKHFTDYVNEVRVRHAQRLLKEPGRTVRECGELAGFITQGYFSRIFKETIGVTPKHYQQQNKIY